MEKTFTTEKITGINLNKLSAAVLLFLMCFTQTQSQIIYGTISNSVLVSFNAASPATISSSVNIIGITPGQNIEGLDFRPNTGELYAFGYNKTTNFYQVYKINLTSGVASAINTATNIALGNGPVGFDFNPTVDRIRVLSANGGSFRLHPVTGSVVATDGNLVYSAGDVNAGATPKIVAAAYINSYIGAATTTLYDYDNALNVLAIQTPPNNGSLTTIGSSGIVTETNTPMIDMDIFYDNNASVNKAYLLANTSASATTDNLYSINLATGSTTLIGSIGAVNPVSNIAVFIDRTLPALTGQLAYGLTGTNLISFDTQNPSFIRNINPITGVTAGQAIVGMDFRPANNTLYLLGYNSSSNTAQVYTVNTTSAVAAAITSTPMALMLGTVSVGFDFNPTVDRIRVVSNNDANYRLEPTTGTLSATDATLNFASGDVNFGANPNVGTIAYSNSFNSATTTTLYNYDEVLNIYTTQLPPNNGTLNTIAGSGIMVNPADPTVDMDIFYDAGSMTNLAFLSANINTETIDRLYSVNLTTGATTAIGKIGFGIPVRDIAIQTSTLTTGITEGLIKDEHNFATIYPNPLTENAIITIKNNNLSEVRVYDITGRMMEMDSTFETNGNTDVIYWNTSGLSKGLYFVNIIGNNGAKQVIKVIK